MDRPGPGSLSAYITHFEGERREGLKVSEHPVGLTLLLSWLTCLSRIYHSPHAKYQPPFEETSDSNILKSSNTIINITLSTQNHPYPSAHSSLFMGRVRSIEMAEA